ncbi:zinc finger-containing ubiquitin peptidase 1-like [Dioscorea cayenensis subsp. rotundata]|uniref:Zinc finger-containing ubiquitin peptidase 1-like n=1 Tax=Dioscorea cayennensis subsp. rotundata TaxID=55577 RepID=A0AB40C4A3_DIOCR|nr:zinc finger-containing ubiquitin peptidase 1-like [Dioscorea cayenensis subsp. rotundata]XP_039134589.1 zinc finger-containing ubiquitin peptidase 1-like [Dioscorea cayenensis subsp. rotundata]XP_039134590.1 zinc finger-containing ubiquitin peptidase 1-like [Dioscorea cayenensis subsp. rotundata]
MLSSCPICSTCFPTLSDLERHVNNHFVDDELERDMELAEQIALAPPSPIQMAGSLVEGVTPESSTLRLKAHDYGEPLHLQLGISSLVSLQTKSTFYKVEGGLMTLLRRCLELEKGSSKSIITGHIDHYQSLKSEDHGWGCGWRNIQMLSSHLLMQNQEVRDVMFGGCGFVPDIPSLQRWLEIAWRKGFDSDGSETFCNKIYGTTKWIGTTECAALLCSFGLRARVVDFDSLSSPSPSLSNVNLGAKGKDGNHQHPRDKRKAKQVYGPLDKFLIQRKPSASSVGVLSCESSQHVLHAGTLIDDDCNQYNGEIKSHHILVDWVWNYFNSGLSNARNDSKGVFVSERTPLYFQYNGHSRTIIGIQRHKGLRNLQDQYFLLVLDPSERTEDLERSLQASSGWQRLIKRGVHTLRKPQYQLCYVDHGIAHKEEMEQLKVIHSILIKF